MGLTFTSPEDLPPGMRKLYEAQVGEKVRATAAKQRLAELTQEQEGKPKKNKYHNQPTERTLPDGTVITFDSKKEAAYFDQLCVMRSAGVVRDIRLQVQFLLKPAYTDGETGERFRAINYLADFTYDKLEDGAWKHHIVDCKGKKTKEYELKRKIMADQGRYIEEV